MFWEENWTDESDIYSGDAVERMIDDDEISAQEGAFMMGYNDAM